MFPLADTWYWATQFQRQFLFNTFALLRCELEILFVFYAKRFIAQMCDILTTSLSSVVSFHLFVYFDSAHITCIQKQCMDIYIYIYIYILKSQRVKESIMIGQHKTWTRWYYIISFIVDLYDLYAMQTEAKCNNI